MTAEEAFEKQLADNPTDPMIRGIFGDWLTDQGDPRGPGYVAMGRLGLVPDMGGNLPGYHGGGGTRRVSTVGLYPYRSGDDVNRHVYEDRPASPDSALPLPWWIACWGDSEEDVAMSWIMGEVLKTIEDNIAYAFQRLPPELQGRYLEGHR